MSKTSHKDKKVKFPSIIGISILIVTSLFSCQQPVDEIILPADSEAFTKESTLGGYLQRISLLDGSYDNIIDNASNLSVRFPVEVSVKGKKYIISTITDLNPIEQLYNINPYVPNFMAIEFPIEVIQPDYSIAIVSNQGELNQTNSISGSHLFDDIECIDFNYPISLATYDPVNQKAKTLKIESDEALLKTLVRIDENELISFNFPISITVDDLITSINNNNELQAVIEDQLSMCDENDRWYYDDSVVLSDISLSITDAPYPVDLIEEAKVTIDRIDVKTGAANDSVPFITLFNDTLTFDLIDLTNGITAALNEVEIPVGAYEFFRVYVNKGSILLKDGNRFDLKIPSGESSGIILRPDMPIIITEEGPNEFLFDFDLSRSFIPKGNSNNSSQINGFNFRPTIKVSSSKESGTLIGKITDIANAPMENAQITLVAADTINAITFSGANGKYAFLGLTAGDYVIEVEKSGYGSEMQNVVIFNNQEINVEFIMSEIN